MSTILHNHKKRIKWLDFIKGLAILFVVLWHSIGGFGTKFISTSFLMSLTSIAMPLFFVVSGYLYKPTNTLPKYKVLWYKKISSFVIPYLIFTYVSIFVQHPKQFISLSYENGIKFLYLPTGYVWFLYVLFAIFIIVGLMDLIHINLYFQIFISILFYIISSYFPSILYGKYGDMNPIPRIGSYIIFFYIGILMNKFNIPSLLKKYKYTLILFIPFAILIFVQNYLYGYADVNSFENNLLFTNIVIKVLGILFIFSLAVNINESNIIFKYFTKYGKATLLIYLVHLPIIYILEELSAKFNLLQHQYFITAIMLFVISWTISILAYYLSKRNKFINFVFYPRKVLNKIFL